MRTVMQEVAVLKLMELGQRKWFDITVLKSLLALLGGELTQEERDLLSHVHCVDYAKLSEAAREELAVYVHGIVSRYIPSTKVVPLGLPEISAAR